MIKYLYLLKIYHLLQHAILIFFNTIDDVNRFAWQFTVKKHFLDCYFQRDPSDDKYTTTDNLSNCIDSTIHQCNYYLYILQRTNVHV